MHATVGLIYVPTAESGIPDGFWPPAVSAAAVYDRLDTSMSYLAGNEWGQSQHDLEEGASATAREMDLYAKSVLKLKMYQ